MNFPEIISQNVNDHQLELELLINPELDAFAGHFDQFPIIPGVVQISWALHFFSSLLANQSEASSTRQVSSIKTLKFQHVITPNSRVKLDLSFDDSKQMLAFRFYNSQHQYSSGKILLTHDESQS
ncbi:ApeI family dehydratase [Kangiella koreensis]|uniref:AMP-binding enzyme family protein n=1 Tax=Kangiella koreensis (strain DSM 16069 / JCM 12317 / KCTC 12182 / SW-125) TaxID=523791 RepID=C7R9W7_KANKD|nr:AMP-binding protein [Kangiella koreensis]ACV27986.1 AMP-binding enzyme family protein [Kangiella koreensis DSM 16069]